MIPQTLLTLCGHLVHFKIWQIASLTAHIMWRYGKKALFQQLFSHNVALFSTGGAQKSQNTQEGLKIDTRIFLSVEGGPHFSFYFEPFFLGRDFCPFLVVDDLVVGGACLFQLCILPPRRATSQSHWEKWSNINYHTFRNQIVTDKRINHLALDSK